MTDVTEPLLGNRREHVERVEENRSKTRPKWTIAALVILSSFVGASGVVGPFLGIPYLGPLAFLSVLPALCFMYVIYWRKFRNTIPLDQVSSLFLLGFISIVPACLFELALTFAGVMASAIFGALPSFSDPDVLKNVSAPTMILWAIYSSYIVAGLVEESTKYVLITRSPVFRKAMKPKPADIESGNSDDVPPLSAHAIVILAAAGALGFATVENCVYVLENASHPMMGLFTGVVRAFLSVPMHGCTGVIIGAAVARRDVIDPTRPLKWHQVMLAPILFHGSFDFILLLGALFTYLFGQSPAIATLSWASTLALAAFLAHYAHSKACDVIPWDLYHLHTHAFSHIPSTVVPVLHTTTTTTHMALQPATLVVPTTHTVLSLPALALSSPGSVQSDTHPHVNLLAPTAVVPTHVAS